ncbi:D-tyrosyl-tRNA(Tyr) deacylase [Parashewanella curva]|uniref:D-aminoacyl-tRNA deacylase n=1 Tax=Parashewanella curva TaxID=2338552 RepID=A0A3L8PU00_9GAMM|nr:D-aminoacyl-tRNA deacylase [Parashewanella curva]RLV58774.1 D-tyrosyl-tRNA(Tyr) deacylase [Parashewanella curva]
MKAIIQRVSHAKVNVDQQTIGQIKQGLVLLLGVEKEDTPSSAEALAQRIINYRVFSDDAGKMNLNLEQIKGELLVISQFTLAADTSRGRRPSFSSAATPDQASTLYEHFIRYCQQQGIMTQSGRFGADMQVSLTNDGPVTFILESK